MLCKIADLSIQVPATGDMLSRCKDYLTNEQVSADIIIRADLYRPHKYPTFDEKGVAYMESSIQFSRQLLNFNGLYLHSSAIVYEGRAYLFSGPSGMGKSTHTRLWKQLFGADAVVINDDKPALRYIDGVWYAYGTPWCGKDGINVNTKAPLGGICFLKRGEINSIRRLDTFEATTSILSQTIRRFKDKTTLDLLLQHLECLTSKIPVYELYNIPVPEAALLSYETMRSGAEEAGL